MFSRICFIFILFVGQLLSSDNKSENKFQTGFNNFEKKVVIPLGVGIAGVVFSHKTFFLVSARQDGHICFFDGILENEPLGLLCGNLKMIPLLAVDVTKISFANGQRMCNLISVAHGCAAAAICRSGLNRFFPS